MCIGFIISFGIRCNVGVATVKMTSMDEDTGVPGMAARWLSPYFKIVCVWPFGLEGLWLRYATLQNLIPSFSWIVPPRPPPWHDPRKGRDQILPSGNLVRGGAKERTNEERNERAREQLADNDSLDAWQWHLQHDRR